VTANFAVETSLGGGEAAAQVASLDALRDLVWEWSNLLASHRVREDLADAAAAGRRACPSLPCSRRSLSIPRPRPRFLPRCLAAVPRCLAAVAPSLFLFLVLARLCEGQAYAFTGTWRWRRLSNVRAGRHDEQRRP